MTSRLVQLIVCGLVMSVAGCGAVAEEPGPTGPATAAEAAKFLDLAKFPLAPGAKDPGRKCLAQLVYNSSAGVPETYAFIKEKLLAQGWKELPGGYESPESASGVFGRAGFVVSASASAMGAGGDAKTMVVLANHGNVSYAKLPRPEGCTLSYEFPVSAMYVAPGSVEETAKGLEKLLLADGWAPYGSAGDTRYYKKNAIKLHANVMAAPAQGGKTVIQWTSEQLSADLPAPADALDVRYSEPPVQLMVDFKGTPAEADAWYRDAMGKLGWKPTTENPVRESDVESWVIYRNDPGEMAEIKFREVDDFTRLDVEYTSADEMAEMEKRWEEEKAKAKEKSADPKTGADKGESS